LEGTDEMNRARILLADDHVANIELISDLLQPEFDVVAQVQDGTALVKAATALAPDVIVCDISMPCIDAIGAAELILRRAPAARIVFVTVHGDPLMVSRAMGNRRHGLSCPGRGIELQLDVARHADQRGAERTQAPQCVYAHKVGRHHFREVDVQRSGTFAGPHQFGNLSERQPARKADDAALSLVHDADPAVHGTA
jgi:CheY-like chemotaxis protein